MDWAKMMVVGSLIAVSGISFLLSRIIEGLSFLFLLVAILIAVIGILVYFGLFGAK